MDEVENPALPAAGESSPTLRPQDDDDDDSEIEEHSQEKPTDQVPDSPPPIDSVTASPSAGLEAPEPLLRSNIPSRPLLSREGSVPPPPQQPPPPAPPNDSIEFTQEPPDSLTLADLKRIRSTFPNAPEAPPRRELLANEKVYDFEYQDAQSLPVELEEWFSYSEVEELKLRKCKASFISEIWRQTENQEPDWLGAAHIARTEFIQMELNTLKASGGKDVTSLMTLTYIGLGVWDETAGRQEGCSLEELFRDDGQKCGSRLDDYGSSNLQIEWIVTMADTMRTCGGVMVVYDALRVQFDAGFAASPPEHARNEAQPRRPDESIGLWCALTLMYLFIEVARTAEDETGKALKRDILALEPNLLNYLTQTVAKLRWDDHAPIPLTKMLLISWKTILVFFGGIGEIEQIKASLHDKTDDEMDARGQPVITASPLDYHLFRQEINSKYPAYQPPAPLFPLEPEHNSILPPLKHRRPSYAMSDNGFPGTAPSVGTHSIMHQPVHIATPAPSPPPSPGGPGKAGKKQNYQTNQMFPFLYPPLDSSSNALGGKGSTELQDLLVGRRWEGSDVPTSILEAAELFSGRMRATRAMRQMWDARVEFMEYERGWKVPHDDYENLDVDDFELVPKPDEGEKTAPQGEPIPQTENEKKLAAVGNYYRDSLPHLQSVVIVLLKAVLANVTDLVTRGNGQNGLQAGIQFSDPATNMNLNNHPAGKQPTENGPNPAANGPDLTSTAEELDRLRTQEIAAKALSAILLLILKWFKLSHVLQYEYFTQLLLDSNYVPLVLKLWQAQDISRACHYQLDRPEANFFAFCQATSRHRTQNGTAVTDDDDDDDAVPPAIKLHRESSAADSNAILSPITSEQAAAVEFQHPPEVDELGYPQTAIPDPPLRAYSFRNLFASINYLRVLQKVTRRKTHRALLLVSYKSSNHLKKSLRVPVRELRYYTLKLFKSQVPFCGRKWRQSNMKIITAVWLSVPAELRDDWLSGGGGGMGGACVGDVDGTVEDALPLEQALRALTHWWNVRFFPEGMGLEGGKDKAVWDEAGGFFERMLEGLEMEDDGSAAEMGGMGNEGDVWAGPIEGY